MVKLKHTKEFYFDFASYKVSDGNSTKVLLKIDYKNNKFEIENRGVSIGERFENEISNFARDLLRRKHAVNFAEKFKR